jgi:uncharacterized protein YbaR (Trm112 family)/SAM-dependent methyltransferase
VTPVTESTLGILRCPHTGGRLSLATAAEFAGGEALPAPDAPLLITSNGDAAYRIDAGVPILLWPEALHASGPTGGTRDPRYAEAYRDVVHYAAAAAEPGAVEAAVLDHRLDYLRTIPEDLRHAFPEPAGRWLALQEGLFDLVAEIQAYRHLAPLRDARVLQVGGRGTHAVKFLAAGAAEAWLLTPVPGEAAFALALAERCGFAGRLTAVVGVGEEPPFARGSFQAIYAPGSLHHMDTATALPRLHATLAPGGRLACVDPWRAPGYGLGTRILGKRERDVACRPLTGVRLEEASATLPSLRVTRHGAMTRYPLIALQKFRIPLSRDLVLRVMTADDVLAGRAPPLRGLASSVCITVSA